MNISLDKAIKLVHDYIYNTENAEDVIDAVFTKAAFFYKENDNWVSKHWKQVGDTCVLVCDKDTFMGTLYRGENNHWAINFKFHYSGQYLNRYPCSEEFEVYKYIVDDKTGEVSVIPNM